jgi:hypothetical protein
VLCKVSSSSGPKESIQQGYDLATSMALSKVCRDLSNNLENFRVNTQSYAVCNMEELSC